jgi:hypothetical protein
MDALKHGARPPAVKIPTFLTFLLINNFFGERDNFSVTNDAVKLFAAQFQTLVIADSKMLFAQTTVAESTNGARVSAL